MHQLRVRGDRIEPLHTTHKFTEYAARSDAWRLSSDQGWLNRVLPCRRTQTHSQQPLFFSLRLVASERSAWPGHLSGSVSPLLCTNCHFDIPSTTLLCACHCASIAKRLVIENISGASILSLVSSPFCCRRRCADTVASDAIDTATPVTS